jgi:hypothetical protein
MSSISIQSESGSIAAHRYEKPTATALWRS